MLQEQKGILELAAAPGAFVASAAVRFCCLLLRELEGLAVPRKPRPPRFSSGGSGLVGGLVLYRRDVDRMGLYWSVSLERSGELHAHLI